MDFGYTGQRKMVTTLSDQQGWCILANTDIMREGRVMEFFHLNWPEYANDAEMEVRNCCFSDPNEILSVPGVKCPHCGTTWAMSGERLVTNTALSSLLRERLTSRSVGTRRSNSLAMSPVRSELPSFTRTISYSISSNSAEEKILSIEVLMFSSSL